MSARNDLLDEYGRADTAPLGTMTELRQKLDAYRVEVLAEAADELDAKADRHDRALGRVTESSSSLRRTASELRGLARRAAGETS